MTSRFTPIDGLDGVYTARLGKLSCTALRLLDGSLCLYSPVAGLEKTLAGQANEIGAVSALFAPNHYHNKGLAGHTKAFPTAALYCSDTARPRLPYIYAPIQIAELVADDLCSRGASSSQEFACVTGCQLHVGFTVQHVVKHGQERHFLLLDMGEHAFDQGPCNGPELAPFRV